MDCESADGGRQAPSLEERMQSNLEKSALRRESLRQDRAQKRRETKTLMEPPQDPAEEVCFVCVRLGSDRPISVFLYLTRFFQTQQVYLYQPKSADKSNWAAGVATITRGGIGS